ncbi:type II toxin-antitoxin system RelE/ParE family toxin [Shinella sp. NM-101]|uniref:type II toxin-antitoxin system RelE/ParE family toxin n=1 Tax=Shinella sp. NM-101 TaxID=2744455 RepID=UPI001F1C9D55|nr:type II toxin-antitoxin system RelE/ParE family toxin [Shinella sp. NM-101]
MKTTVLPSARADILKQIGYLIDLGLNPVADRFLEAVRMAIDHVSNTPHAGSPRPMKNRRLLGLRTWSIGGFDEIKLYYLVTDDELVILRVLHGRRDIEGILEA